MKPRPRSVEREVAKRFSEVFARYGIDKVKRIPALGRTGPDIEISEQIGLVIDVKSRKSCPKTYFLRRKKGLRKTLHGYLLCELENFDELIAQGIGEVDDAAEFPSRVVDAWWKHMDAWREANHPDGISVIVLHRPRMPIGKAVVVIKAQDRRRIHDKFRSLSRVQ
jgi:hypothetical protein